MARGKIPLRTYFDPSAWWYRIQFALIRRFFKVGSEIHRNQDYHDDDPEHKIQVGMEMSEEALRQAHLHGRA